MVFPLHSCWFQRTPLSAPLRYLGHFRHHFQHHDWGENASSLPPRPALRLPTSVRSAKCQSWFTKCAEEPFCAVLDTSWDAVHPLVSAQATIGVPNVGRSRPGCTPSRPFGTRHRRAARPVSCWPAKARPRNRISRAPAASAGASDAACSRQEPF